MERFDCSAINSETDAREDEQEFSPTAGSGAANENHDDIEDATIPDSEEDGLERRKNAELGEAVDGAINAALAALRFNAKKDTAKASVADLVRLLQLRRELNAERPRKITIRWVDECRNSTEK